MPHIYANSQKDAMVALGYAYSDRLWQMELMRRIAPRRLSEIFRFSCVAKMTYFFGFRYRRNCIAKLDKNGKIINWQWLIWINFHLEEGQNTY